MFIGVLMLSMGGFFLFGVCGYFRVGGFIWLLLR